MVAFDRGPVDGGAPIVLTPVGQSDGFVAKLDGDLSAMWANRIGEIPGMSQSKRQQVSSVAIDGSRKSVAACGSVQGTVDFGVGGPFTANGLDAFALALDSATGAPSSVRYTHGSSDETATGIGFSPLDGKIWVVGTFLASPAAPPLPNWGTSPATELVFATDDGTQEHTYLAQLSH
jgi:hypothetical protein